MNLWDLMRGTGDSDDSAAAAAKTNVGEVPRWLKCAFGVVRGNLSSMLFMHVHREEDASDCHGHITSLAVARTHRKLGLATRLMQATREFKVHRGLQEVYRHSLCCTKLQVEVPVSQQLLSKFVLRA
jgi:ribosomal protein S18 acetylase RimI-like enzyme